MNDSNAAEAAKETKVAAETPAVCDPMFINTDAGAVAVFGHEFISKKDLVILAHCLTLPELSIENGGHKVKSVVFRIDSIPKDEAGNPILASCCFDAGAIIISLMYTFTKAVEVMLDEEPDSSIVAIYQRNLILNYLHEINHLGMLDGNGKLSDSETTELEELAGDWSTEKIYELAQTVDIEPAHHAESAFLAGQIIELLLENDEPWAKHQRLMLDNHNMYNLVETDKHQGIVLNFKGYMHLMSSDESDNEVWNKETILGAGVESPLAEAIRPVNTEDLPTDTPPEEVATAGGFEAGSEAMELEDPGAAFDPNLFGPDGMPTLESLFEPPVPGEPLLGTPTAAGAMTGGPTYTGFPIAGQEVAAIATETGPAVNVFPQTGLDEKDTADICQSVYAKCYNHIFGKCERVLNSDVGFQNPDAVATIPIVLTEQEKAVIVKCDCLDENGRFCEQLATTTALRGSIMKNTKLPTYKLYINVNGQEKVRVLLPQNPGKIQGGAYTKTALQARGGSCIMYIMEGNDAVAKATGKKFLCKIVDGKVLPC